MNSPAAVNSPNITLADVRAALLDSDPLTTNASKVRTSLGRGSLATIQRHLDTIRTETAPTPTPDILTPPAPADLATVLWHAAYARASVLLLSRTDALSIERDALHATAARQTVDIEDLAAACDAAQTQVDTLTADAIQFAQTSAQTAAQTNAQIAALTTAHAATQTALTAALADADRLRADALTTAQSVERDAKLAHLTMQTTVDRLTDQIGELKALRIAVSKPRSTTALPD